MSSATSASSSVTNTAATPITPVVIDSAARFLDVDEPLLTEPDADVDQDAVYPEVIALLEESRKSFWRPETVVLTEDKTHWRIEIRDDTGLLKPLLNAGTKHFIKHVIAFFAKSDKIVSQHIVLNMSSFLKPEPIVKFYNFTAMIEDVHHDTYQNLLKAFVEDMAERANVNRAIETMPVVKRKAEWALKWMNKPGIYLSDLMFAFACVEGIFFSGSFCAIYWLKRQFPGYFPGFITSNEYISRDEGLHCRAAATLHKRLKRKIPEEVAIEIIREAVDIEKEFVCEALPVDLLGMNKALMSQYIEYVADYMMTELFGFKQVFGSANPFEWMGSIALTCKANFFESHSSQYVIIDLSSASFSMNHDC